MKQMESFILTEIVVTVTEHMPSDTINSDFGKRKQSADWEQNRQEEKTLNKYQLKEHFTQNKLKYVTNVENEVVPEQIAEVLEKRYVFQNTKGMYKFLQPK